MAAGAAKVHGLVACALLLLAVGCQASPYWPLEIGFYHDKCPQAEAVVKGVMAHAISQKPWQWRRHDPHALPRLLCRGTNYI
jgi:peroxidase